MFQPVGDKPSLKERGQGHVTNFSILHPEISTERLKLQISNFVHGLASRSTNFQMNCPLSGRDQGHVMHSRISHPRIISGTAKASVVNFSVLAGYITC